MNLKNQNEETGSHQDRYCHFVLGWNLAVSVHSGQRSHLYSPFPFPAQPGNYIKPFPLPITPTGNPTYPSLYLSFPGISDPSSVCNKAFLQCCKLFLIISWCLPLMLRQIRVYDAPVSKFYKSQRMYMYHLEGQDHHVDRGERSR